MIIDSLAFLENKRELIIPLKDGSNRAFSIALNFSTRLYMKMISSLVFIQSVDDIAQRIECLFEICTDILRTADSSITSAYLAENVEINNVMDIITKISNALKELMDNEAFEIPDIEPKAKEISRDAERQKTKEDIERLQGQLKGVQDNHLIDDVVIVMEKTGSCYNDVMNMPILVFRDVLRSVVVADKRQDDNWNLAYLENEYKKVKDKLRSGEAIEPQTPKSKQGVDINKLRKMLG